VTFAENIASVVKQQHHVLNASPITSHVAESPSQIYKGCLTMAENGNRRPWMLMLTKKKQSRRLSRRWPLDPMARKTQQALLN
jgi:hypothetical protein